MHEFTDSIHTLLVEDDPGVARLMVEIFKDSHLIGKVSVVEDGVDALDFLRRRGKFDKASRPHLILLDLNLPRKDGREVLQEIKADPELKRIPVVVLTASMDERDIFTVYNLHANCYIHKPVGLDRLIEVVNLIEKFWFSTVRLPLE